MKLVTSICLLTLGTATSSDRIRKYPAVEAYEIRPGVVLTPIYTAHHDLCEIGIEKRHYFNNKVDMNAAMTEEEILSMFDELVPMEERGGPAEGLPPDTEISESDLGMLSTRVPYEDVTVTMYGLKDRPDRQKYIAAIISWNDTPCSEK